jgi:hypothetical protein
MRSWPIEETVLTAWLADTAAGGKGDAGVVDPVGLFGHDGALRGKRPVGVGVVARD